MRLKLALASAVIFGVALLVQQWTAVVVIFCGYVVWTWVRMALEKRARLRDWRGNDD